MPYKNEVKDEITKAMSTFLEVEKENKVTIYNMSGLTAVINNVLAQNFITEKK